MCNLMSKQLEFHIGAMTLPAIKIEVHEPYNRGIVMIAIKTTTSCISYGPLARTALSVY